MNQKSRILNAIKNVGIAGILQIMTLILSFVSRTFFVKLLGNDYLSCEGLFSNILTILSFSELGIGSAIIFSLYKPIADEDQKQICKLMNLFRTAYRYIALFITLAGMALIPFLDILISDVPDIKESIALLYCLFLANTVASYILGYKRTFLIANQENYIVLLVQQGIHVIKIVIQIWFLYLTHDYVLFLLISIICTLATNITTTIITDRKYPWLNHNKNEKLTKSERKPIFANISAIVQYKLGSVVLNGTDNIIISVVLKTSLVGLVSNYNLIISAVNTIANQACGGLQATIGNFNVSNDADGRYKIFRQLYFISFWVFGFCAISLANLLTPFVSGVWLGKEYSLPYDVVLALSLSFYILFINTIPYTYRCTLGYFKDARMCPLYASILNVVLSVVLAQRIGLSGIFFATAISRFLTYNIIDPIHVFRKGFGRSEKDFFAEFFTYLGVLVITYLTAAMCVNFVSGTGFGAFIIKFAVNCVACNAVFLACFFRTSIFRETANTLLLFLRRRKGRA